MNTNLLAGVPFETFLTCKHKGTLSFKNNNLLQVRQEFENKILSYDNTTFTAEPTTDFVNTESIRLLCNAMNPIIPIRRISSIPDRIENKDYASSIGLATIAAILLPEDLRDMRDAGKQFFSLVLPKKLKAFIALKNRKFYKKYLRYKPKISCKDYQTPFSFIRGSFLEKPINKMGKAGYYLHKWDKTIFDTKIGKKIAEILGIKVINKIKSGRKVDKIVLFENQLQVKRLDVDSYKLQGGLIGKLICRSMQRVSIYGFLTFSALCLPEIVRAFNKPEDISNKLENGSKQLLMSVIKVFTTLSSIGLVGTLFAPFGPIASITGMGVGSVIASTINKTINSKFQIYL